MLLIPKKINSASCQWGRDNEKVAISRYKILKSVKAKSCGLTVNSKWLGCSPDGLVRDNAVDVKCSYTWKDSNILKACNDKNFFMKLIDGVPVLKNRHNYFYQCQGVMAITELMEIDFVVLMGDNIFVQTINFDEAVLVMRLKITNIGTEGAGQTNPRPDDVH